MIIKLAFIFFMLPGFLPAQDLTGTWTGTANFGAEYVKLVIVRDGDRYIGYTYDTGGGGYCKVNFEGKFNSIKQKLSGKGMGFIEKTFGHSQCVFNLNYSESNGTAMLKGGALPKSLAMNIMTLGITAFTRVTLMRKSLSADTTAFMSQALHKSNKNVGSNNIINTQIDTLRQSAVGDEILKIIRTRTTDTVQTITTSEKEITIQLIDNGIEDGDSISVLLNNNIIASRQRLSHKPIVFKIPLDSINATYEVTIVAYNLGSIPPNTAMVLIEAGYNKYTLYASSSLEKNAMIKIKYVLLTDQ